MISPATTCGAACAWRDFVPSCGPNVATLGIDLASQQQPAVLSDHESTTLAKAMFAGPPWVIGKILDWVLALAERAGFAGLVSACEPAGHRCKPLLERRRARGGELICVHPSFVAQARAAEDFTKHRADLSGGTLIARLAPERRCRVPYLAEDLWSRLRHLGVRRNQLLVPASAARPGPRDLLECS